MSQGLSIRMASCIPHFIFIRYQHQFRSIIYPISWVCRLRTAVGVRGWGFQGWVLGPLAQQYMYFRILEEESLPTEQLGGFTKVKWRKSSRLRLKPLEEHSLLNPVSSKYLITKWLHREIHKKSLRRINTVTLSKRNGHRNYGDQHKAVEQALEYKGIKQR